MAFTPLPTTSLALSKLAGAAGVAAFLLGLLLPILHTFATSALPLLLLALRTCFSPPYLFFTINLIILVIWKLSETGASEPTREIIPAAAPAKDEPPKDRILTAEAERQHDRCPAAEEEEEGLSDSSCVTSDAEEGSAAAEEVWKAVRGAAESRKVVAFDPARRRRATEEEEEDCTDEMDRRFEAFIKKVNDQMRLQRHHMS